MSPKRKLVLILEDVASYSKALEELLREEDFLIVVKKTQSDARTYLKSSEPDLIFCDGEAPDGAFIHAIPKDLWSRVIGISGSRGYNDNMKQRGAQALVPKMGTQYDIWARKAVAKARLLLG
jgi:CheY-like chemotaxis protein